MSKHFVKIHNASPEDVRIQIGSRPFKFLARSTLEVPEYDFKNKDPRGKPHNFSLNLSDIPERIIKDYGDLGLFIFNETDHFEELEKKALNRYLEKILQKRLRYFQNYKEEHLKAGFSVIESPLIKKSRIWAQELTELFNDSPLSEPVFSFKKALSEPQVHKKNSRKFDSQQIEATA